MEIGTEKEKQKDRKTEWYEKSASKGGISMGFRRWGDKSGGDAGSSEREGWDESQRTRAGKKVEVPGAVRRARL